VSTSRNNVDYMSVCIWIKVCRRHPIPLPCRPALSHSHSHSHTHTHTHKHTHTHTHTHTHSLLRRPTTSFDYLHKKWCASLITLHRLHFHHILPSILCHLSVVIYRLPSLLYSLVALSFAPFSLSTALSPARTLAPPLKADPLSSRT
jgi:hypothetical protein